MVLLVVDVQKGIVMNAYMRSRSLSVISGS